MEVEAKFSVPDPEIARRLQDVDQIAGLALFSTETRHLHDVYLDTPDLRILTAGYSCRFRQQDDGVLITIKAVQMADDAIHRREQVEALIPPSDVSPRLQRSIAYWPPLVRDRLAPIVGDEPLVPLVDLNQTRLVRQVKDRDRLAAELSLDKVCADSPNCHLEFSEVEVELMPDGSEQDLARIAGVLQNEWGLQPELVSKFDRAYSGLQDSSSHGRMLTATERETCLQIAAVGQRTWRRAKALLALDGGATQGQAAKCAGFTVRRVKHWEKQFRDERMGVFPKLPVSPVLAEPRSSQPAAGTTVVRQPGITRDDSMAEAARKTVLFHFERMLEHESGARAGEEIEELHDMRVATRRMRAALFVFDGYLDAKTWKPFARMLRRTGRALGRVRDLDVFRVKTQTYLDSLPPDRRAELDPLLSAWQKEHDAARQDLLAYFDGDAYVAFKAEFGDFLRTPGAGARPDVPAHDEPRSHIVLHVLPIILYQGLAEVVAFDKGLIGADVPLTRFHQLRIASKRLRYSLEFFEEVLGPDAEGLVARIKALQDHLGNLQDGVVTCEVLRNFLVWGTWGPVERRKQLADAELVIAPGVAAYLTARQKEIQELRNGFPSVWDRVRSDKFRRKLGTIVKGM